MTERREDPFFQKLSAIMLPIMLIVTGYFAQGAYQRINDTLQRIETSQSGQQSQLGEIRMRIYQLEQQQRPPAIGLKPPVADPRNPATF